MLTVPTQGKAVGDLGCGGGTLGLGCAMLGAGSVLGVDIDPDSLALVSAATLPLHEMKAADA